MMRACLPALLLAAASLGAAERETALVDGKPVVVTNRAEITIQARNDDDVQTRELWYRVRGAGGWGRWEKNAIDFGRNTPITWKPAEGHVQVYVRVIEISGQAMEMPGDKTRIDLEFIMDRTAPQARIAQPQNGAILSTGAPYTITWDVADSNLHSKPVSLFWARDESAEPTLIAEGLPNSGSFQWTTPSDMSNQGRLVLTALDKALNSVTTQASGIIVDGVAPQRAVLGPASSQSRQVPVAVRVVDAGPARQVAWAQLWHSADGGRSWTAGPKVEGADIATIAWTAANDGEYQLTLVAADIAGNMTPVPTSAADSLATCLVDSAKPAISFASVIGINDARASADGSSRNVFKPGDQVVTDFRVDDMRLSENPVTIAYQVAPEAPWQNLGTALPANKAFAFSLPDVNSRQCRIRITAVDAAGNIGEAISKEPFTIDNKVEHVQVQAEL